MSELTAPGKHGLRLYRSLFDAAGDSIVVCSAQGIAIECNQATLDLFDCTRDQLIGSSPITWSPEFQPEERRSDEMAADVFTRAKAGEVVRFEWENLSSDGKPLSVDVTVRFTMVDGDELFVVVSRNINSRRQAEEALRESYESLRKILETTLDGFWTVDAKGFLVDVNPTYCQQSGYTHEELVGMSVSDLENTESPPETQARIQKVINKGADRFETQHRRKDGSIWDVEVSTTFRDVAGGLFFVFLRDVTGRKRIEESLRESEARLKEVFENIPLGIFISLREEGKFKYVNPVLPKIFGYSSSEEFVNLINRTSFAETFWVDPSQRRLMIERYDRDQKQWGFGETRCRRKDGTIIDIALVFNGRRDPNTHENLFYGIVTDVSERKRAETELIAAKDAAEAASITKSRFLAAASHDLRQPMQAIKLFNDALARTKDNGEQKRLSEYLSQSIQSMGELLNALLDFSQFDAGAIEATSERVSTDTLIDWIDREFSQLAAENSLRFKLSFPFGSMVLITDGKLVMRLLANLIGNAVKYTDQGGILVAIRRRGNHALIQVWDTGNGIATEHKESIFEEYFQVGNPERDRTKGLGLGLAIAKRIANLLKTELVCHSRQGKGSVFEFRLPLAPSAKMDARLSIVSPAVESEAKPAGRRIALVEDDDLVSTATKLALESCGMTVARYKSAEEALADGAITDADFYISDLWLPGLNGIEFLDAVQKRATLPIRAVVLTGDTSANKIEMMRSNSWRVLFKPVELKSLLAAIESRDSVH
ncbi:MAG: PAS domain S-box protein [Sulfuritalea sp.]|nr:PAS domain S-box protein [Sulfuritalea sp.]